ncbi:MAG: GntR family transcriptional regulator [Propionibacteriaceae bacterium]|jgi:GntR family transcriptional regulator|nr:GntR family transcriptional regulator [Propionibacteriaceae bacterium]
MDIVLSPASDKPIYVQIAEQIAAQILKGDLAGGTTLPPIRTVARQLAVSVITVKKAWEELARAGFIDTVVGRGTFVSCHPPGGLGSKREAIALERLEKDLAFYRELGLTAAELIELVRQVYGE